MKATIFASFLTILTLLASPAAHAGFIEVGSSGSFRRSVIDTNAYDESMSLTASVSYILDEASAIEMSYTDGRNKRAISEGQPNGHVTQMFYKTIGLDFVYTIGAKSSFRPYVKAGVNQIISKRIVDQYRDSNGNLFPANIIEDEPGLVPSAGTGFRVGLTESLSLKVGVDAWTSRPTNREPVTIDYMGRAGLSLLF